MMKPADSVHIESPYILGQVMGGSMEPTLSIGDTVVIDTRMKKPRRGDVVALKSVVHRFVWRDPFGGLWHSGDRFKTTSRAPYSSLQGTVKSVIREGDFVDVRAEEISNCDCLMRVAMGGRHEVKRRFRSLREKLKIIR